MKTIHLKSLANGEIILKEDLIEFSDKSSRMNKVLFKLYPFLFLVIGIYQVYMGMVSEREVQLILRIVSGILLLSIPVTLYHSNFLRTNKAEVQLKEINAVKLKRIFGEFVIDFTLKNGSTRRVYNIREKADWNIIKQHLTERNITCLS